MGKPIPHILVKFKMNMTRCKRNSAELNLYQTKINNYEIRKNNCTPIRCCSTA